MWEQHAAPCPEDNPMAPGSSTQKVIPIPKYHPHVSSFIPIHPNTSSLVSQALESWLVRGIIPKMAQQFRLVKYYNLPIYIYNYIYISSSLISLPPMPKD